MSVLPSPLWKKAASAATGKSSTAHTSTRAIAQQTFTSPPPSARRLSSDGEAPHAAALSVVVVHCVVQRAAVVPHRERARLPADTAGELGARDVRLQPVDQRLAFLFRHVAEADGVAAAHIQRLLAGLRMRARRRVLGFIL